MTRRERRKNSDHRTRVGRERSARTERRILAAALRLFADMGLEAPTTDDVVRAAGVSRGTFYNYFTSVDELLAATSEWTTREAIAAIEEALQGIEEPALRFSIGLRLFFAKAQADPVWCRFVARVWKIGGLESPARDIERGLRLGVFRAPIAAAVSDLLFGGVREALLRIGAESASREYGAEITRLCLTLLGADARRIAAVMKRKLPRARWATARDRLISA